MNMKPLLIGMFFGLIAQVLTFFQLQGQLKYEWFKTHYWAIVLMGIPISVENISSNRFETKNLKLRIMLNKSNNLNKPHNSVITYILCYAPFNYGHKLK